MKWAADPSCYKTATSPLAKCSIRRVKDLARLRPGRAPEKAARPQRVEAGGLSIYRGGGGGEGWQGLEDQGDCTRGRVPP